MKLVFRIILVTTGFMFVTRMSFAVSAPAGVKKGNSLYRQGKYDEALKYYNEAEVNIPDSDVVKFNTGAALYRKGDYEKAIEAFTKALLSDNPNIEEKAAYNIGNSKFRSGKLKENTDLASAVDFYRQALDYYKRAIELNQDNTDAKYNHEFVEKELKILLDKLRQQQEQPRQDSQQKQEQPQSAAIGEDRKEQEQRQREAAQGEEKKEEQESQTLEQAKSQRMEEGAQEEMSEEEARMILDRYNQQDRLVGNMNRDVKGRHYPPVLKDW